MNSCVTVEVIQEMRLLYFHGFFLNYLQLTGATKRATQHASAIE